MKIKGFGFLFERVEQRHLELLRNWRNSRSVNQFLVTQDYISKTHQQNWFATMDMDSNFQFVVSYEGKPFGCMFIKFVDFEKGSGEPGIYVGEAEYLNTFAGPIGTLLLIEIVFRVFRLQYTYSLTHKDNVKALHLYKTLGARENDSTTPDFKLTEFYRNEYLQKSAKAKKAALLYTETTDRIDVYFTEEEVKNGLYERIKSQVASGTSEEQASVFIHLE